MRRHIAFAVSTKARFTLTPTEVFSCMRRPASVIGGGKAHADAGFRSGAGRVALTKSARGFVFGGCIVLVACVLQPDRGFALGFVNQITDSALIMAAYAAVGFALLVSNRMQRTMKAFSRS
jgi:hypothetical protein